MELGQHRLSLSGGGLQGQQCTDGMRAEGGSNAGGWLSYNFFNFLIKYHCQFAIRGDEHDFYNPPSPEPCKTGTQAGFHPGGHGVCVVVP